MDMYENTFPMGLTVFIAYRIRLKRLWRVWIHIISPLARSGCPQAQMDTTREGWGLVVGVFARRCVLRVDV